MTSHKTLSILLPLLVMAGSCTFGGPDFDLSRGDPSADLDRMRRRMNVRLYREGTGGEIEDYEEVNGSAKTARDLAEEVVASQRCAMSTFAGKLNGGTSDCAWAMTSGNACEQRACVAQAELCIAEELLSFAALEAPETITIPGEGDWLLPGQSAATKAAFAREAYRRASRALVAASQALHLNIDATCSLAGPFDEVDVGGGTQTRTLAEASAAAHLGSLSALDDALDVSRRALTAVADAQMSDEASIEDATRLAITLPEGSRSDLAHLFVGGSRDDIEGGLPALQEISEQGFCPEPRMSPQARQALELVRIAAVPPAVLLDESKTISDILDDWGGGDGLRARLAVLLSADHLDPVAINPITLQEFYDGWGLDARAFEEAREHLVNEIRAYGRPLKTELPPEQVTASVQTTFPLFAATRTSPQQPLPVYWGAIGGHRSAEWVEPGGHPGVSTTELNNLWTLLDDAGPTLYYDDPGLNTLVDVAATVANRAVASPQAGLGDARELLGAHSASIATRRPGRIQYCWHDTNGPLTLRARVYLDRPANQGANVAMVTGREGLDCLVRGHIEGTECDWTTFSPGAMSELSAPAATGMGSYWEREVALNPLLLLTDTLNPIYVEPMGDGRVQVYFAERVGNDWIPLGGGLLRIPTSPAGGMECLTVPIVPEADEGARDALAPSTTYCAMSAQSCAGVDLDQRIPLENELTSDGTDVESSWRHYLQLARQSADRADQLGEDLIRSGLEMDLRAEAAIDELEDLCGVSLNISGLGAPNPPSIGGSCTTDADCDAGYVCQTDTCVLDPVALAMTMVGEGDRQRLADCLGSDATEDWTALGDVPLCFWWEVGDASTMCEREDGTTCSTNDDCSAHYECVNEVCRIRGSIQCPFPAEEGGTCPTLGVTLPGTSVVEGPAVPLSFFVANPEIPSNDPPDPSALPCEQLALLRATDTGDTRTREQLVDEILGNDLFRLEQLQRVARQLSWAPLPGDYSHVRIDDGRWLSTGEPYDADSGSWPCLPPSASEEFATLCPNLTDESNDPADASVPFFCHHVVQNGCAAMTDNHLMPDPYDSSNRVQRAMMNDLMARAVLAARIVTGVGLQGVRFPYVPRTITDYVAVARAGTFSANPLSYDEPPLRITTRMHGPAPHPSVRFGGGGVLGFDDNDGLDETILEVPFFDMNRGNLFQVQGATSPSCPDIPVGAEWTVCPYDYSECTEIVDDASFDDGDCDDSDPSGGWTPEKLIAFDRDLGLIVRAFEAEATDGSNSLSAAQAVLTRGELNGYTGLVPFVLSGGRATINATTSGISDLTNYWRRSSCGDHNQWECNLTSTEVRRSSDACVSGEDATDGGDALCTSYVGCRHHNYWGCRDEAEARGFVFDETFDGNRAFIASTGLNQNDILNGLELICAAARRQTPGGIQCAAAPEINSVGDLFEAESFLQCQAGQIAEQASRVLFSNLPARAVSLTREGGVSGAYGTASGENAAAADELRAALLQYADINSTIETTLGLMASDVRTVRSEVRSLNLQSEISDWSLSSRVIDQATACAVSISSAVSADAAGGAVAASVAICANSVAQTVIAIRINDLEDEVNQQAVEQTFAAFERSFTGHTATMSDAYNELRAATARIEAANTRIKNLRSRGRRALARALMLDSVPSETGAGGAMGRQFNVNTAMRRRHNTLRVRYEAAYRSAVRLAFIAKLALEQRLGMGLDEMTEPMTLLDEPPADWHMDVCSMSGIDYDRIRAAPTSESGMPEAGEGPGVPEDYSGEYIGDYVRKLELTFESYSFDYPFQDGTDSSVMSLRDEVWGIRDACEAEVPNLLYEAGQLDAQVGVSHRYDGTTTVEVPSSGVGWTVDGCSEWDPWPPTTNGSETPGPPPACLTAEPLAADAGPIPASYSDFGTVPGYRVHFGTPVPPKWSDGSDIEDAYGSIAWWHTADTRLIQWVVLPPGRYRVSYFARDPDGGSTGFVDPREMLELVMLEDNYSGGTWSSTESAIALLDDGSMNSIFGPTTPSTTEWDRFYAFFDIDYEATVGIAIVNDLSSTVEYRAADIAGLMLEDVTTEVIQDIDPDVADRYAPRPFFNTAQNRQRVLHACEDTDGSELRRLAFQRRCLGLCPDGYGECPGALQQHCYYETSFSIDPDRLQQVGILEGAGFAFGNFNYRVERVGINLVGTGLRDCSESATPSTCYASGNVAYSIIHDGPYPVRNHRGRLYDAPLFRGRVERARAVAAERYLTNPLSSADRGLIEPYMRRELNGRPMGGNFLLRIWDDPGLVWENVEDVQVVLDYRYWTRQE